jgi:twitching motility protein PilT
MARIDAFLRIGREQGGSDIHFTVGMPPLVRLDGELNPIKYRSLTLEEAEDIIDEILTDYHREILAETGAVDLSHMSGDAGRFRINVCRQLRGLGIACRVIPDQVPRLAELGLPPIVSRFTTFSAGLVLVTGTTGTGKSTTLAAIINEINVTRNLNIITLEDPVEFLHTSSKSQVVQREVGTHLPNFKDGLRSALREDPDVILVGELRDAETISLALEAAETGHLVFGTLHTRGAAQTIDRIIDALPSDAQGQVRHSLADNLKCVLSQELLRVSDGRGRRVATEVLVVTMAVAQLVREGKTFQIPSSITTGRRYGMQLMDQSLLALVRAGDVDPDEAFLKAIDKWGFAPFVTRPELLNLITNGPSPDAPGKAA